MLVFSQGPFKRFTAIVGPNGAGKSNLMDAISFVLGVRTMQLRGQQLRDLIFRKEGEETVERDAYVKLSFAKASAEEGEEEEDDEDDEAAEILTFARKISSSGASSYVLNGRTVTWERYSKALAEIGVNVTSRKFLVFQGDVESIAGMAPRELTTYFEKVSGSDELKDAYGSAEASKNQSEATTTFRNHRSGWPSVVGAAPAPSQSSQQQPPQRRLYIRHPGRHVAYPAALLLLDLRYGFPGLGHLSPAYASTLSKHQRAVVLVKSLPPQGRKEACAVLEILRARRYAVHRAALRYGHAASRPREWRLRWQGQQRHP